MNKPVHPEHCACDKCTIKTWGGFSMPTDRVYQFTADIEFDATDFQKALLEAMNTQDQILKDLEEVRHERNLREFEEELYGESDTA
jgi:hypothetical protein